MMVTGTITVKHRGYTVRFVKDFEKNKGHWYGHILYIKDLITAMAENVGSMAFEARGAVDDYIDTCEELGVEPNKPGGESE